MSLLGINVWFMCKHFGCNNLHFENLIDFVQHKRKQHFIEFQNVRCIVFEESTKFYPVTSGSAASHEFACDSTLEVYHTEEDANNLSEIVTKLVTDPLIISSSSSVFDNIVTQHNPDQAEEIFPNEPNSELNDQIINSAVTGDENLDIEILPNVPCQNEQSETISLVTMITNTNNAETTISPASKSTKKKSLSTHIPLATSSKIRIKKPKRTEKTLQNKQSTQLIPNPYIFVRRLTPMQIQNATSAAEGHQTNLLIEDLPKLKRRRKRPTVQPLNFECPSCHKIMTGRSRYSHHIKICGRAKKKRSHHPRICDECGLQCFDLSSLKIHKLRKHRTEEEKAVIYQYTCPHCPGRSFLHKSILDDHTKTWHGLKPNLCHECGMSFLRPSHLAKHVLLHSEESPFKCQEPNCGKAFKIQSYLEVHMASHTKLRLFPCPDPNCNKKFKHPSYATKHLRQVPHGDAAKAKAKAKAKECVSTGTEILLSNK